MSKKVWVLHSEDVDMYDINIMGVFDTAELALQHVRDIEYEYIDDDATRMDGGFGDWINEHYDEDEVFDEKVEEQKYITHAKNKFEKTVTKRKAAQITAEPRRIRKPTKPKDIEKYGKEFPVWKQEEPINKWKKAKRGFYWGIHFYRLTETDSHS